MAKWLVNVLRTGYASRTIEVSAESEVEAKDAAMEAAGNFEFSEHASDYECDWVKPTKTERNA